MNEKYQTCEIKYKDCKCYLVEYTNVKNDTTEYKYLSFKKNYQKKFLMKT